MEKTLERQCSMALGQEVYQQQLLLCQMWLMRLKICSLVEMEKNMSNHDLRRNLHLLPSVTVNFTYVCMYSTNLVRLQLFLNYSIKMTLVLNAFYIHLQSKDLQKL